MPMVKGHGVPVVNINGTPRADLVASYISAIDALRAADTALAGVVINGRDYPGPDEKDTLAHALREHAIRRQRITYAMRELVDIVESIR